jgi:hypothetical protein
MKKIERLFSYTVKLEENGPKLVNICLVDQKTRSKTDFTPTFKKITISSMWRSSQRFK